MLSNASTAARASAIAAATCGTADSGASGSVTPSHGNGIAAADPLLRGRCTPSDARRKYADMTESSSIPLPGSDRSPLPDVQSQGPAPADAIVSVTVVLRRRADGQLGAEPDDLQTVVDTLQAAGLEILLADAPSRRVRVQGTVAQLSQLFGTSLDLVTSSAAGQPTTHRYRTGTLQLPVELDGRVLAVLGLDDRPQAMTRFRVAPAAGAARSYTPIELGEAYTFPPDADGAGQTVAIIELGGGFAQSELDEYFAGLGITVPQVTAVGVDGATNQPGADPSGADGEVLLDIEVVGALANGASVVVYFGPNTDAGFLDAVSEALHADPTPAAISISWGQNEEAWTLQARQAMDSVFADAVTLGVVVTAAAGDTGSSDGVNDGNNHVDFPASSPNVLACGGTSVDVNNSQITSETVWNDGTSGGATGGGVSIDFPRPPRQSALSIPGTGRGVPDVAGDADPETGYQVLVDGQQAVYGGTSAVAPLWAALVARLAQARGGLLAGFLDVLYEGVAPGIVPPGLRDITDGNNGSFSAAAGWDACTGLGSPDGAALLQRLAGTPAG